MYSFVYFTVNRKKFSLLPTIVKWQMSNGASNWRHLKFPADYTSFKSSGEILNNEASLCGIIPIMLLILSVPYHVKVCINVSVSICMHMFMNIYFLVWIYVAKTALYQNCNLWNFKFTNAERWIYNVHRVTCTRLEPENKKKQVCHF